ncbi:MAG: dethiobiotin synthase, partial [Alphaproteobacteria bacterium]|nr:dethiobiotin synthase [Alphaproteobacteria bacterium]
MTRIIFVGATGTDSGKTYVTVMLLHQLQDQGYRVRAVKPVISGFDPDDIGPSDSGLLLAAMGRDVTLANITTISPWRYRPILPPHLAAQQQGQPIIVDQVVDFCQEHAGQELDFLLVEGVGGIMTPLNYRATTLDLMVR